MGFQPKYQTKAVSKVPTSLIEIQATSLSVELCQIQFITQYVSEPRSNMHFNKSNITYTNLKTLNQGMDLKIGNPFVWTTDMYIVYPMYELVICIYSTQVWMGLC